MPKVIKSGNTYSIDYSMTELSDNFRIRPSGGTTWGEETRMPKPSNYTINPKPLSSNAERVAGTGELFAPFLRMCYEIVWEYKYLSEEEFRRIYNAYIGYVENNKSLYIEVMTLDSNASLSGGQIGTDKGSQVYSAYVQGDFTAPMYHIMPKYAVETDTDSYGNEYISGFTKTNQYIKYYKDVTFTFVTR